MIDFNSILPMRSLRAQDNVASTPQVLVHAGTGGVGLAALQVARAMGCQVHSTAGSAMKRSFLRTLGVLAAGSSRDAAFTDIYGSTTASGKTVPHTARF